MATSSTNSEIKNIYSETNLSIRDNLILSLYRREPERAVFIAKQLNSPLAYKLKATPPSEIDAQTENIIKTIFRLETSVATAASDVSGNITSGISALENSIVSKISQTKLNLNKSLAPVSRATGEVLAGTTKILENPLGAPFLFGNSIGHLIDKINPGFTQRLDATYKKLGLQNLSNFPAQVVGSIKQLMSAASSIACLPLSLIGELNQLLIDISNAINKLIDKVSAAIYDFFFGPQGVLDSILPLDLINDFLSAVSELTTVLGAIGILSGGSASFLNTLSQVNTFTNTASLALSNPLSLATLYAPNILNTGSLGQVLNVVRNPGAALQGLVPPDILSKINQLSNFCSIAQSGDLGFALSSFIGGPKARALQFLLNKYADKSNTIKPLLNAKSAPQIPEESLPQEIPASLGTQKEDKVNGTKSVETQQATRPQPPLEERVNDEKKATSEQLQSNKEIVSPPIITANPAPTSFLPPANVPAGTVLKVAADSPLTSLAGKTIPLFPNSTP